VTIVDASTDLAARSTAPPRGHVLVNLAAPGALGAVASLRKLGAVAGMWGYLAVPDTGQALKLGRIELAAHPMDPETILALLDGHLSRGTRVLTAGADADALMSLRQALSRQGASVAMAWDGNQAQDLLAMTRPGVAVIDLDLPPRGGYGVVAALADLNPVPTAVLVSRGADGAARFAAEARDRSRAPRFVSLQQLLGDTLKGSAGAKNARG
jgi:DNA-binding NtrC family response regulator